MEVCNEVVSGKDDPANLTAISSLSLGIDEIKLVPPPSGKTPDGRLLERMLFRTDEANLSLAEAGRPWAFDAPGGLREAAIPGIKERIEKAMSVTILRETDGIALAAEILSSTGQTLLPVVDGQGRLTGVISRPHMTAVLFRHEALAYVRNDRL